MLAGTQKPMLGTKLNRAHPLSKGLVGCWLFNEGVGNKAYDLSGYRNHGTLTNMAFPSTAASGWNPNKDGVCLTFDGSSDYIDCSNDSSLNITDAITIEAWVKPNSTQIPVARIVYTAKYRIFISGTPPTDFGLELIGPSGSVVTTNSPIQADVWQHVITTYDSAGGANNIKTYYNGVLNNEATRTGSITPMTGNLYIGATSTSQYFNGSLDGVKIYNRALSALEIGWLHHKQYAMFERGELLL